jgi:hypothetical protein
MPKPKDDIERWGGTEYDGTVPEDELEETSLTEEEPDDEQR